MKLGFLPSQSISCIFECTLGTRWVRCEEAKPSPREATYSYPDRLRQLKAQPTSSTDYQPHGWAMWEVKIQPQVSSPGRCYLRQRRASPAEPWPNEEAWAKLTGTAPLSHYILWQLIEKQQLRKLADYLWIAGSSNSGRKRHRDGGKPLWCSTRERGKQSHEDQVWSCNFRLHARISPVTIQRNILFTRLQTTR